MLRNFSVYMVPKKSGQQPEAVIPIKNLPPKEKLICFVSNKGNNTRINIVLFIPILFPDMYVNNL